MTFVHRVFPVKEHADVVVSGELTATACVELIHRLAGDPQFSPHFSVLIDVTDATYDPLRPADLVEVAGALNASRTHFTGPIALVARGSLLLAAETFATLVRVPGYVRMRVFVDPAAAQSHCGLLPKGDGCRQATLLPAAV